MKLLENVDALPVCDLILQQCQHVREILKDERGRALTLRQDNAPEEVGRRLALHGEIVFLSDVWKEDGDTPKFVRSCVEGARTRR